MNKMKYLTAILLSSLLVGCLVQASPNNNDPAPVVDTNYCKRAEVKLEELQCLDLAGDPMWVNKRGERFGQTCKRLQEEGGIFLDPRCISNSLTCDEANSCPAYTEE